MNETTSRETIGTAPDTSPSPSSSGPRGEQSEVHTPGDVARMLSLAYASEPETLSFTREGIWLATPLMVLDRLVEEIAVQNILGPESAVCDAGVGDGRVLAAFALRFQAISYLRLIGVECDPALAATARERLTTLRLSKRVEIAMGDFHTPLPFEALGISFSEIDLFLHYPDGNELELLNRFEGESEPGARLIFLSPQLGSLFVPGSARAPDQTIELQSGDEAAATWMMRIYIHP